MISINKDATYIKAINGIPVQGQGTVMETIRGKDLDASDESLLTDRRLALASYENTMDVREYLGYIAFVSGLSRKWLASNPDATGRYVALLDLGYMPAFYPPTFLSEKLYDQFFNAIRASGVKFLQQKPLRFDGTRPDASKNDIWVSKTDAARLLGKPVEQVTVIEFLKEVVLR